MDVVVAELGMGVELRHELENFQCANSHLRGKVGVATADDLNQIFHHFRWVQVLLEKRLLLLNQIKVLAHEQVHCEGV